MASVKKGGKEGDGECERRNGEGLGRGGPELFPVPHFGTRLAPNFLFPFSACNLGPESLVYFEVFVAKSGLGGQVS